MDSTSQFPNKKNSGTACPSVYMQPYVNAEYTRTWKDAFMDILKNDPEIFLERLEKTTRKFCYDNLYMGRGRNPEIPKYEVRALTT
jgi:hypothetical protein